MKVKQHACRMIRHGWVFLLVCTSIHSYAIPFSELLQTSPKERLPFLLQNKNNLDQLKVRSQQALLQSAQLAGIPDIESPLEIHSEYFTVEAATFTKLIDASPLDIPKIERIRFEFQYKLYQKTKSYRWSSQIKDHIAFLELLFSFKPQEEQAKDQVSFSEATTTLKEWLEAVNQSLLNAYPGFNLLSMNSLQKASQGQGVKILVFDLFNHAVLERQRLNHPHSKILPLRTFGNPPELDHGNFVIDIILSLAPKVTILPIQADSKHYAEAFADAIHEGDVNLVNFSRALPEKDGVLDPEAWHQIEQLSHQSLIVKAMGNCGTDLNGELSPLRKALNLGPLGGISCYDTDLIRSLVTEHSDHVGHWIFAVNGQRFSQQVSETATVPGPFELAQIQTLTAPAEGVYSLTLNQFDSGSSFAAPQVTAITALLLGALGPQELPLKRFTQALFQGALPWASVEEAGQGLLQGDSALALLKAPKRSFHSKPVRVNQER